MRITKIYILLAALMTAVAAAAKAPAAESVLDALRAKIVGAPSVEAVFTINGGDGAVQGSLIMSGSKYAMSTPQMKAWFDGRTQWTTVVSSKETNVSEPDHEDIMSSNPFAILTAHKDYYRATMLKSSASTAVVELTPRSRTSAISKFTITVDRRTGWPSSISVTFDDGRRISVKIDSIAAGSKKAASTFVYNPKAYPAFEVVDLR